MTASMPSTTRQTTRHGSSPLACMAQVARRDSAAVALLAWTVAKLPAVPVFSGLEEGLAPRRRAPRRRRCDRAGGAGRAAPGRGCHVAADQPRASKPRAVRAAEPQLQRVLDRDDAAPRPAAATQSIPGSVVFPEPVPRRSGRCVRSGARPPPPRPTGRKASRSRSAVGGEGRPPKRRIVIAVVGTAGGLHTATHEPSASRASMIGSVAGSSPSGRAIWIAARATTSADGVDVLDLRVRHQHLPRSTDSPSAAAARRRAKSAASRSRPARALRAGGDPALQLRIDADAHDAPAPPPRSAQQVRWVVSCTSLGVIPVWRRSRPRQHPERRGYSLSIPPFAATRPAIVAGLVGDGPEPPRPAGGFLVDGPYDLLGLRIHARESVDHDDAAAVALVQRVVDSSSFTG